MNSLLDRGLLARLIVFGIAVAVQQGCNGYRGSTSLEKEKLSWQSSRMRELQKEYDLLWLDDHQKQRENPGAGKHIVADTARRCRQLFGARLSWQDLHQLAAACESLPVRFRDRQGGFRANVLEHIITAFVAIGDQDALVDLLSRRFVGHLGGTHRIEFYLASEGCPPYDFRGNRLKDPILILGEAYSKCELPDVRKEIAAAVRRGFVGLDIPGKDGAEFVANAMQWYASEKDRLVLNHGYWQNEIRPLHDSQNGSLCEKPGDKQPLFVKTTSKHSDCYRFVAVSKVWAIHASLAAILSAPILWFGRKRIQWQWWELVVLVLPFCVWLVLMTSPFSCERKALGNFAEALYLAVAVPVATLLRISIGSRVSQRACAAALIILLCMVAVAVFFLVPPLL